MAIKYWEGTGDNVWSDEVNLINKNDLEVATYKDRFKNKRTGAYKAIGILNVSFLLLATVLNIIIYTMESYAILNI